MLLSITAIVTSVVPASIKDAWRSLDELQFVERLEHAPISVQIAFYNSTLLGRTSNNQIGVWVFPQPETAEQIRQIAAGQKTLTRLLKATFPDRRDISFETATLSDIRNALGYAFYMPVPSVRDLPKVKQCFDTDARPIESRIVVRYDKERLDVAIPGESSYDGRRFAHVEVKGHECMRFAFTLRDLRTLMDPWYAESDILLALKDQGYRSTEPTSALELSSLPIWRIVEDRTVSAAKAELTRRLEFSDSSQELFGLSTSRSVLVVALPVLIAAVQLLLWLHILAAQDAVTVYESHQVAWIGIYKRTASRLISDFSIFLFPAICIGRLLSEANREGWMLLAVIVSGAFGIGAVISADGLRKRQQLGSAANGSAVSTPVCK